MGLWKFSFSKIVFFAIFSKPGDFVNKVLFPEDSVHRHPDVTIGGVVTVEVDAPRRL